MSDRNDAIIRLRGISRSFGGQRVLDGIDLDVRRGETMVVLGESGVGKSVLLKIIVLLLRPDVGKVWFEGAELTGMSERELSVIRMRFGFLFQGGALFDSMNAIDNVAFPMRQHSQLGDRQIRLAAGEKLEMVGLGGAAGKMPAELSGGQQKRVALARAIAMDPQVILYDEPTTGLDPIRADVINGLIRKLQSRLCVTSIVVTHDMNSAYKVADRVKMLHHGQFIFDGTVDELRRCPDDRVRRFVAGQADREQVDAVGAG